MYTLSRAQRPSRRRIKELRARARQNRFIASAGDDGGECPRFTWPASVIAVPLVTSARLLIRGLQSVFGSVAIRIGAAYPGDCVQFDSTITHRLTRRLTILSSEVCVRTHGHCLEADLGLTLDSPLRSEASKAEFEHERIVTAEHAELA